MHLSFKKTVQPLTSITRYQTLLGCTNIDLTNTTELYARFTTSVICNAIIQNSIDRCGLSAAQSQPLCADTCVSNTLVNLGMLEAHPSFRLNTRKVKAALLTIATFAKILGATLLLRFVPILRNVPCQAMP